MHFQYRTLLFKRFDSHLSIEIGSGRAYVDKGTDDARGWDVDPKFCPLNFETGRRAALSPEQTLSLFALVAAPLLLRHRSLCHFERRKRDQLRIAHRIRASLCADLTSKELQAEVIIKS